MNPVWVRVVPFQETALKAVEPLPAKLLPVMSRVVGMLTEMVLGVIRSICGTGLVTMMLTLSDRPPRLFGSVAVSKPVPRRPVMVKVVTKVLAGRVKLAGGFFNKVWD